MTLGDKIKKGLARTFVPVSHQEGVMSRLNQTEARHNAEDEAYKEEKTRLAPEEGRARARIESEQRLNRVKMGSGKSGGTLGKVGGFLAAHPMNTDAVGRGLIGGGGGGFGGGLSLGGGSSERRAPRRKKSSGGGGRDIHIHIGGSTSKKKRRKSSGSDDSWERDISF